MSRQHTNWHRDSNGYIREEFKHKKKLTEVKIVVSHITPEGRLVKYEGTRLVLK